MIERALPPLSHQHSGEGVYFIRAGKQLKIGHAADVQKRLSALQTGAATTLHIEHVWRVHGRQQREALERFLHRKFSHLRVRGEWFEWTPELRDYIDKICDDYCHL